MPLAALAVALLGCAAAQPGVELSLDLPIGLASSPRASAAGEDLVAWMGLRGGTTLRLDSWRLGAEFELLASLPDSQGGSAVRTRTQEDALFFGLRVGPALRRRGFVLSPHLRLLGMSALHLAQLQVGPGSSLSVRPVFGGGLGAGLMAGHGSWRLRWDSSLLLGERGRWFVTSLSLGYAW